LIREIKAKSVLTLTKLPGADYVINPYVGCHVGCTYCYASFMKRVTKHIEPWGKFVDVKINAAEILEKEIKLAKKGLVLMSSVTDPYQSLERKYSITRKILQILLDEKWAVSVLTKCNLVLRDVDILKQFGVAEVGFSISSLDEKDRVIFEPASSTVEQKISALKELHDTGISTYAFIGPVLPQITNVSEILKRIGNFVDMVWVEAINFKAAYQTGIFQLPLQEKRPDIAKEYAHISQNYAKYFEPLKKEVEQLKKEYSFPVTLVVH